MTQSERRLFLIRELIKEQPQFSELEIPPGEQEQKYLLRSLFNIRMPKPVSEEFLKIQDVYLKEEIEKKSITDFTDLKPNGQGLYLWQGDITTLACDAIVNAANSEMLGCFCPCHGCIDNAIHTYAGIELRLECAKIMEQQGFAEPTGKAKITKAYNLPCKYIIHTVGPVIKNHVSPKDEKMLASCYTSCLEAAEAKEIKSIAFCCISTGEFCFPNRRAAEIAIETVRNYKEQTKSGIEVIFNVFKSLDYEIYRELLG